MKPRQRESKIDYLLNSEFLRSTRTLDWFSEYARVVREYSKRSLSFESDVHNAFTGVMNKFSPYIEGTGFMSGHPLKRFDNSLLWYPTSAVRRRKADVAVGQQYPFPTWSWMGWVGSVDFDPDLLSCVSLHVLWFRWSEYGLVPVRDNWHLYTHPKADTSAAFQLALLWKHAHLLRRNIARIIAWCSTVKRRLRLPEHYIYTLVADFEQSLPCFIIQDADGDYCGFLPSVDRTWAQGYKSAGGGECELLILSTTHKSRDDLKAGASFLHDKYLMVTEERIYFQNIMLLEFDAEGIAYRRGVGLLHVDAVDWTDALSAERKIIVLG